MKTVKPIVRTASLDDLPVLLEFEQGLIDAERPMDPHIQSGNISYYSIEGFIRSNNSEVIVATLNDEIVASGYARILDDKH
ncbi:MAG: GNAT family N-acetyltransferase, partial [Bacteroidota bacterium]